MSTERLFVNSSFTPQLRGVNLVPPAVKIVSWSEGTDAEIAALLDAHYAGTVNLHEIWNIGDTRAVHLSAMPATGVNESHVEQDVEFQLVNAGGKELADGTECAFIVQLKDVLTNTSGGYEGGYMYQYDTNSCGWIRSSRRIWCNDIFRNSLPEMTRNFFKLHKNKTSKGNLSSGIDETEDWFALPAAYNLYGSNYSLRAFGGEDSVVWSYYNRSEKRKKYPRGKNSACTWWLRSPDRQDQAAFCTVSWNTGGLESSYVLSECAIAPFGTI